MNKSVLIFLLSLVVANVNAGERDELLSNVQMLPIKSRFIVQDNKPVHKHMPGLKGGGPLSGAWGYSATKGACWGAVGAAATYAVVQSGGAAAPVAKVILSKAIAVTTGSATLGEAVVASTSVAAKAGVGAKIFSGIGTGAAALGSYLPWAIEGVSGAVGAALTAIPFIP